MLQLCLGLFWLAVGVAILVARETLQARGHNVGLLAAVAGLFAVHNFVRCVVSRLGRRRREPNDDVHEKTD